MKESRFIELLNLYVDQELSPAEATELEAEIAAKPARRRTYEQYCRMQRGSALLFESSRAQAPEYSALARSRQAADEKIMDFPEVRPATRRAGWGTAWGSGLTAAAWGAGIAATAAAVAVAFLYEPAGSPELPTGAARVAESNTTPAAVGGSPTEALAAAEPTQVRTRRTSEYPVAALLTRHAVGDHAVAQFDEVTFDWMNQIEHAAVPRLSIEDLRFGDEGERTQRQRPSLLQPQPRPAAYTPGEAFNAFEFRR